MSELETLKKKLEEAEAENEQLRKQLGRKKQTFAFPDEVLAQFPNLEGILYATREWKQRHKQKEFAMRDELALPLSKAIRGILFHETARAGKGQDKYITCREMDDQQFKLYVCTLRAVLQALSDGIKKKEERV